MTEPQVWGQVVMMGIWGYDGHVPTAQPVLCGHRELRQLADDGRCVLPLAIVQQCQASQSISPGWKEREAWRAGTAREAKITSLMLSRSEKLFCFLNPFLFATRPVGVTPEVFLRSSCRWGFFFQIEKKIKFKCHHAKAGGSAFPLRRSFTSCAYAFWR